MYRDNRDSLSATELVSSFLNDRMQVPVVIVQVYRTKLMWR